MEIIVVVPISATPSPISVSGSEVLAIAAPSFAEAAGVVVRHRIVADGPDDLFLGFRVYFAQAVACTWSVLPPPGSYDIGVCAAHREYEKTTNDKRRRLHIGNAAVTTGYIIEIFSKRNGRCNAY